MKDFIVELGLLQSYRRNSSFTVTVKVPSRTKHIQRRYHWLRERVEEEDLALTKFHTKENGSDMLTKVLSTEKLDVCRRWIGMASHPMPG